MWGCLLLGHRQNWISGSLLVSLETKPKIGPPSWSWFKGTQKGNHLLLLFFGGNPPNMFQPILERISCVLLRLLQVPQ